MKQGDPQHKYMLLHKVKRRVHQVKRGVKDRLRQAATVRQRPIRRLCNRCRSPRDDVHLKYNERRTTNFLEHQVYDLLLRKSHLNRPLREHRMV
jgi:hypothetical protein